LSYLTKIVLAANVQVAFKSVTEREKWLLRMLLKRN
jgi:hypothetical protein